MKRFSVPTHLPLSSQPLDDVTQEDEQRSQEGKFLMYHFFIASGSMLEVRAKGEIPGRERATCSF